MVKTYIDKAAKQSFPRNPFNTPTNNKLRINCNTPICIIPEMRNKCHHSHERPDDGSIAIQNNHIHDEYIPVQITI